MQYFSRFLPRPSTSSKRVRAAHRRRRIAATVIGFAALMAASAACSAPPAGAAGLVGKTLDQAEKTVTNSQSLAIYDLSNSITGQAAQYSGMAPGSLYTVVVACSGTRVFDPTRQVALGIIKNEAFMGDVQTKALAGGFNSLMAECAAGD